MTGMPSCCVALEDRIGDIGRRRADDQPVRAVGKQILEVGDLLGRRIVGVGDPEFDVRVFGGALFDRFTQGSAPGVRLGCIAETEDPVRGRELRTRLDVERIDTERGEVDGDTFGSRILRGCRHRPLDRPSGP